MKNNCFLRIVSVLAVILTAVTVLAGCVSSGGEINTGKTEAYDNTVPEIPLVTTDAATLADDTDAPYEPSAEDQPKYETDHFRYRLVSKAGTPDLSEVAAIRVKGDDSAFAIKAEADYIGCEYILKTGTGRYRATGDWGSSGEFEPGDVSRWLCEPSILSKSGGGLVGYIDNNGIAHDVVNGFNFSGDYAQGKILYYGEVDFVTLHALYIITLRDDGTIYRLEYNKTTGAVADEGAVNINIYGKEYNKIRDIERTGTNWWVVTLEDGSKESGIIDDYFRTGDLKLNDDYVNYSAHGNYINVNFEGHDPICYDKGEHRFYIGEAIYNLPDSYTTDNFHFAIYNEYYAIIIFTDGKAYIYDIHTYNNGKNNFFVYDEELTEFANSGSLVWYYERLYKEDPLGGWILEIRKDDGYLYQYDIEAAYKRLYDASSKIDF